MPERFLSSEEYDEQAHKLYNDGDYDGALEMLKEGLSLYPNAVELYVGLGYARLAREEFAWARTSFERALVLDPAHEDALVGLGETLLRFGERDQALRLFAQVAQMGYDDDVELMLTMGRALYREAMYAECRDVFAKAAAARPDNAEAAASLGYALHRLGDEVGAGRQIRRALRLDPDLHEARVYLGHLLYDRGDWEGALREFERVPPMDHWDSVSDPMDRLLSEVESQFNGGPAHQVYDPSQLELFERGQGAHVDDALHQIRLQDGYVFRGTWHEIVRQMRDHAGFSHETLTLYM